MEQSASGHEAWVETELATLSLGDDRLDKRARHVVLDMINMPTGSIPQMSEGWAPTIAVYRFLANPRVAPAHLRQGLTDACEERVRQERVVLALQDTTSLDFDDHTAFQGGGPLGGGDGTAGNGLFVHSAIAVSDDGVPLGLLHQEDWVRDPDAVGSRHKRKSKPIEEKESYNWIKTKVAVEKATPDTTTIVHVGDRESDMYAFLAQERRPNTYILVRACRDRCLVTEPEQATDDDSDEPPLMVEDDDAEQPRLLMDAIAQAPVAGEYPLMLRSGKDRPTRDVQIQVRFCEVKLKPPEGATLDGKELPPVNINVIRAEEVDPPADVTPISWLLLTDLEVSDLEQACQCIRRYTLRWLIERYHYVLKSGCRIEESQITTVDALRRLLALYCAVALRLLWLTYAARVDGDQPCTVAFSQIEWKTLHARFGTGQPCPHPAPTIRQVVLWLSRLGGFLARNGDGDPGVRVIWRGLMRLQDIVIGVLLAPHIDVYNE
jgi:hypothetical protein